MATTVHLDQFKHNEMYLGAKSAGKYRNGRFFFQARGTCFAFRWGNFFRNHMQMDQDRHYLVHELRQFERC